MVLSENIVETTFITVIRDFSFYLGNVPRTATTTTTTTTTAIFLGPRCFATRGQKLDFDEREMHENAVET